MSRLVLPSHLARLPPISTGGGGGGASTVSVDWTKITGWSSLFDPDSRLTSFTNTDGQLTYEVTGDTTVYEGYRENGPGVEIQIQAIPGFSSYDADTWRLFIFDHQATFPLEVGGDRFGLSMQITDETLANRATATGTGWGRERVNATTTTAIAIGTTATGPGGTNNIGDHDAGEHSVAFTKASGTTYISQGSRYRTRSSTDWVDGTIYDGVSIDADPATHYLAARVYHRTSTDAPSAPITFVRTVYIAALISDYPA